MRFNFKVGQKPVGADMIENVLAKDINVMAKKLLKLASPLTQESFFAERTPCLLFFAAFKKNQFSFFVFSSRPCALVNTPKPAGGVVSSHGKWS